MRLAVDNALADSGLAAAWQRGFIRDTGVAVILARGPATALLEALERGEHDASLTNAPAPELALEQQGLAHGRQRMAVGRWLLVGPAAWAKPMANTQDITVALSRLAQAQAPFISRPDGSGTHRTEQGLWLASKLAPTSPWYQTDADATPLLAQASRRQACTLVEQGVWLAQGAGRGASERLNVLVQGDSRLAMEVNVMRSFRARHPAAKLFAAWLAGPKGQAIAAAQPGYRAG